MQHLHSLLPQLHPCWGPLRSVRERKLRCPVPIAATVSTTVAATVAAVWRLPPMRPQLPWLVRDLRAVQHKTWLQLGIQMHGTMQFWRQCHVVR